MIKALKHLSGKDRRAIAVFYGIVLLCSLYFASGILVSYVTSPSDALEMSKGETGFAVHVMGLQTYNAAEQLSNALRDQRQVQTAIEAIPGDQGYVIKVGPLTRREAAESLTSELHDSGYGIVKIVEVCPPGGNCNPAQSDSTNAGSAQGTQNP